MLTDRQTDVGHISLIGGLVTHNPPKNTTRTYAKIYVFIKFLVQFTLNLVSDLTVVFDSSSTCVSFEEQVQFKF